MARAGAGLVARRLQRLGVQEELRQRREHVRLRERRGEAEVGSEPNGGKEEGRLSQSVIVPAKSSTRIVLCMYVVPFNNGKGKS